MEIRIIKPSEQIEYTAICNSVFFGSPRLDIREMRKKPDEHGKDDETIRLGYFSDTGKLLSALSLIPYEMRLGDKTVKMGGIGAVVTRPDARAGGFVRKLFDEAFQIMVREGYVYSFLYPFSFDFYRKFGYELCYARANATIPMYTISGYHIPPAIEEFEPGGDTAPYEEIYRKFTADYSLSLVRSSETWRKRLKRDPYKNLEFTYLFRDESGQPVSYILYGVESGDGGSNLDIDELCWVNPTGLQYAFGFIQRLGAEFSNVKWSNMPAGIVPHAMVADVFDVSLRHNGIGMGRLVDVAASLATMPSPEGQGQATIEVQDSYLPQNSGIYTITWQNGQLSVAKTNTTPHITTTVETLAQLVTGYLSLNEAALKQDTTIVANHKALAALFTKKNLYLKEYF
ncbi:MAG: GNAT family N-acetyltransferase [Defluviitaleaceae bacterium]|nr:GNAT family N-acetyltransferase [Defluviitaleaceae bacterium]